MTREIPWPRILVEGLVIVASILLAFAIDAAWERAGERRDEADTLRLLSRDLAATLEELEAIRARVVAGDESAAIVIEAISSPHSEIDRVDASRALVRAMQRVTLALPSSAYTDLVSSGGLRLISDRGLGDEVLQYYQFVERVHAIISQNNVTMIDGMLLPFLYSGGLVLSSGYGNAFEYREDPLWDRSATDPVWEALRGQLHLARGLATIYLNYTGQVMERASALKGAIDTYLEER